MNTQAPGHIIVCGLGQIGYRVVSLLLDLGEPVTVVAEGARAEWLRTAAERGARVILGDARDHSILVEAGILEARAVIAATNQDLTNVEIALDARQHRPDIPTVVRVFDQDMAHALEDSFGVRRALAMSALAAPSFAAAALGEQVVGAFELDGSHFIVGRITVERGSLLAGLTLAEASERYRVAVLAYETAGERIHLKPPSTVRLKSGDRITVTGTQERWDHLAGTPILLPKAKRQNPLKRLWLRKLRLKEHLLALRQIWLGASVPLRTVFAVLNLTILFSVFIFSYGLHLSLIDALYFVVATVTTVGYGDITPASSEHPLSDATITSLKLYGCLLMLLGTATVATFHSIITDLIVTARFQQVLGRQRIPDEGHVVVIGLGNVGYRVVNELLALGARVVAVERTADGEFVEAVRSMKVPVVIGDARVRETLDKVALHNAIAIIAATSDDVANLGVALAAERANARVRTVVRFFDSSFASKVEGALNVNAAISASVIAGPTFAAAALFSGVRNAFVLDNVLFVVRQCAVDAEWEGRTPEELRRNGEAHILLRARGERFSPAGDQPLQREETVLAVVSRRMEQRTAGRPPSAGLPDSSWAAPVPAE